MNVRTRKEQEAFTYVRVPKAGYFLRFLVEEYSHKLLAVAVMLVGLCIELCIPQEGGLFLVVMGMFLFFVIRKGDIRL